MKSLKARNIQSSVSSVQPLGQRLRRRRTLRGTVFLEKDLKALWHTHLDVPSQRLIHYSQKLKETDLSRSERKELSKVLDRLLFRIFRLSS